IQVPVASLMIDTQPQPHRVSQRDIKHPLSFAHGVVPIGSLHVALKFRSGLLRDYQYRTAVSIASKERALRTLEDLQVLWIKKTARDTPGAGRLTDVTATRHHRVGKVDRHRRCRIQCLHEAAD